MNKRKKKKAIVKYRKPSGFNIGVVIFVIIFIYLVFNIYSYLTEVHISVYEVEQGTIAVNNVYKGLILRSEKVYQSDYSGALNHYIKEGSKVAYGDLIYSVDEEGDISSKINEASQDGTNIDAENLEKIENSIHDFIYSYDDQSFYQVYSFKENVNASLSEALSVHALQDVSDYVNAAEGNQTFHRVLAEEAGILVYYTDGFESVTADNFTSAMFDESTYEKRNLKADPSIQVAQPAYKLIDSEYWNIVIPIPDSVSETLKNTEQIKIRFLKDSKETYASCSITEREGHAYLVLSLSSDMIRYISDRYVEVELMMSEETGLKIPNSAITEKEFYAVPISFFSKNEDTGEEGLSISRTDKNGTTTTEFVSPTIYYATEDSYYIDSEKVSVNDLLVKKDSKETYHIGVDIAALKGVYNINKGYAVFKQIDILYQNEEYSIVKIGTAYGITLYDHIALDGEKVKENQLIK